DVYQFLPERQQLPERLGGGWGIRVEPGDELQSTSRNNDVRCLHRCPCCTVSCVSIHLETLGAFQAASCSSSVAGSGDAQIMSRCSRFRKPSSCACDSIDSMGSK